MNYPNILFYPTFHHIAQAYEGLEKLKASLADFEAAARMQPDLEVAFKGCVRVRNSMKALGML